MIALNERIAHFYNKTTDLWLNVWGEHMHQGYYRDGEAKKKDPIQAQTDLITELLKWADVKHATHILDAGCGVGGSSRYLAKKYHATVTGYTLSSVQAEHARVFNRAAEISDKIKIVWDDVMNLTREKFDLIWSLESAEHFSEKEKMMQLFFRHLEPGGKLVMATWCRRHGSLSQAEEKLLNHVYENFQLPSMISLQEYEAMAIKTGFENVVVEDWSKNVVPFWDAVMRSAMKFKNMISLIRAGKSAINAVFTLRYMKKGYKSGLIQFCVLKAEKA